MPVSRGPGDLTILVGAGVATVALTILSFIAAPVESVPAIDGSSFASHPQGGRAAYLALQEAGYRVERSFEPVAALRHDPAATVLLLAEPLQPPSRQDRRALEQFVQRGGTLVAAGASSLPFLPAAIEARAGRGHGESATTASMVSPLSDGVPEARMTPPPVALSAHEAYVPVYGDRARPFVLAARFGEGCAIWWSGAEPLTNRGIAQEGHAELLVNALGRPAERIVLWDEHYHGHSRSLWSYLAGTPVPFAGAQIALIFTGALFAFSRRRWPARRPHVEPRTSPLEFVESMGALYERAGVAAGAVATVRARMRRTLLAATGIPSSAGDEGLASAAADRASMPQDELHALLAKSADASRQANLRPDEARRIVIALQQVAARVRPGGTPGRRSTGHPLEHPQHKGDAA